MPDVPVPGGDRNALAAILFISSATNALDVYSATNSSPWTAHKFAADEESVEALWKYVMHAIAITMVINTAGSVIARSPWPIIGAVVASAYMTWLYMDAVNTGAAQGQEGWESPS